MIRRIEALNYRCLRYIAQDLDNFHVLVGPNASGKTTFLDVVAFLGDLVAEGLDHAITERTHNFDDLIWKREGRGFELAVEFRIPEDRRQGLAVPSQDAARYEVQVGRNPETDELAIVEERLLLKESADGDRAVQQDLFPQNAVAPDTLMSHKAVKNTKTVVSKAPGRNDNFYDETGKGWDHSFQLGPRKSALANLPEDESRFPVGTWVKSVLSDGVQSLVLNSAVMRRPSPPGKPKRFLPDGSNLPWVVHRLREGDSVRHDAWIAHLRTSLPDLIDVRTVERAEDRHRYLVVCYENDLEVPSWTTSDGTLRLMALTLPAYLSDLRGVFLIEEPENGIHPRAVEAVFQSLSSVYDAQILLATHSPVILSIAEPSQVLCFAKTDEGATDVIRGSEHPRLKDWRGETNLGVLFAGGVLG